jgi:hypothetical protein
MSRNANGEGSVWQRKDGRWCAAAYLPVVIGGRRRVVAYGKNLQEARTMLRDLPAPDAAVAHDGNQGGVVPAMHQPALLQGLGAVGLGVAVAAGGARPGRGVGVAVAAHLSGRRCWIEWTA